MGLISGGASASDLILDGKSVSLYVGGNPPTKVWPTRETVQITLGTGTEARNQLLAALADRGLDDETVTEIPFDIELVGTGWAQDLFAGYYALKTVPKMDTSGVTQMGGMFWGCESLTHIPDMDTSQVTNMGVMFYYCTSLTHVPEMDTSNVTAMDSMFYGCSSLTHAPALDTSQVVDMGSMFDDCSALVSVPDLDTSQVTDTTAMFFGCSSLVSVPDLITSNVEAAASMFYGCSALTDGNVRLIGRHQSVYTSHMITGSGLTREPWYNADGTPIPRVITFGYEFGKFVSPSGDLSLLSELTNGKARFTAPVTCDKAVWADGNYLNAGGRINAGVEVDPSLMGTHLFTEIV